MSSPCNKIPVKGSIVCDRSICLSHVSQSLYELEDILETEIRLKKVRELFDFILAADVINVVKNEKFTKTVLERLQSLYYESGKSEYWMLEYYDILVEDNAS